MKRRVGDGWTASSTDIMENQNQTTKSQLQSHEQQLYQHQQQLTTKSHMNRLEGSENKGNSSSGGDGEDERLTPHRSIGESNRGIFYNNESKQQNDENETNFESTQKFKSSTRKTYKINPPRNTKDGGMMNDSRRYNTTTRSTQDN